MPAELKSAPAINPLKTKYLFSKGAPYGTDEEGDKAQAAAQLEYASVAHDTLADRAPFEMAASFQETIGGNPLDNQNRHGYAIVDDAFDRVRSRVLSRADWLQLWDHLVCMEPCFVLFVLILLYHLRFR